MNECYIVLLFTAQILDNFPHFLGANNTLIPLKKIILYTLWLFHVLKIYQLLKIIMDFEIFSCYISYIHLLMTNLDLFDTFKR